MAESKDNEQAISPSEESEGDLPLMESFKLKDSIAKKSLKIFYLKDQTLCEEPIVVYRHLHTEKEEIHCHDFFELQYIYSGCGEQIINDKGFFVRHGDLVILDCNDKHCFVPHKNLGIFNCLISPSFLSEKLSQSFDAMDILTLSAFNAFHLNKISPVIRFDNSEYYKVEEIFEQMEGEPEKNSLVIRWFCTTVLRICSYLFFEKSNGWTPSS